MENVLITVINYVLGWVQSFFAEVIILFLLVGLAFILFGIFVVVYQIKTQIHGQKIVGTVIGAVKDVKIKTKDNQIIKKTLHYGTLWPVFEYTLPNGITRQDRGSAGGSHVYKYKTGQSIKLIAYKQADDFFVRDAKGYFIYILGIFSGALGSAIIYYYIAELSPQFNGSTVIWLGAIISLLLRYKNKILKFIKDYKNYKENSEIKNNISKLKRAFDPKELRPIEYFVNERAQRRKKHR